MKKIIAMLLVIALTAAISVGATMAYLQDTDEDVNVMTLGNVQIAQHEYERVVDENGNFVKGVEGTDFTANYGITESYKLQPFTQAKPAYPAVYTNAAGTTAWDEFQQLWNQVGAPGSNDLFDDSMKNVIDKFVFVENTGKSDCYYRTLVAIERPDSVDAKMVHLNFNNNDRFDGTGVTEKSKYYVGRIEIDGVQYSLYNVTYNQVLTPGEVSRPSLLQVYLDPAATNEDCAKFGPSWEILVMTQAVQTNGFANAATALNTAFGEITATSHPWTNTVLVDANNSDELLSALTSGKDIIVNTDIVEVEGTEFNGNGTSVTLAGVGNGSYGYLAFAPGGIDATVSNLTVSGSGFVEVGHWDQPAGKYTVNKLTVKDLDSTLANGDKGFTLACGFCHYGDAVLNDCVMTGTTAISEGAMAVDAGFVNGTTTVVNGGEYGTVYCWSHAVVTIDDAYVDTLYVAPIKGTVTIKAGTHIDTLKVAYGTSGATATRLAKLIIEEGATVGKIVFSDNSTAETTFATVAEWNAFVANMK